MRASKELVMAFVICGCLCFSALAWSQAVTATVVGTVSDSTGAVVPNATVKLTNQGTGGACPARS
jgi:hypothetical protein